MFSGYEDPAAVTKCYAAGANYFVRKPASFDSLKNVVRIVCHGAECNPPDLSAAVGLPEYKPRVGFIPLLHGGSSNPPGTEDR